MEANSILILLLGILTFDFILDQVLDFLNLKNHERPLPEELNGIYDEEKLDQSLLYHRANAQFGSITSAFNFLLLVAILSGGVLGAVNKILLEQFSDPVLISLAFFAAVFIASDLINMPFSLYKTFVIEEKFGFNKTSLKTFILDKLKGYLIAIIVGGLVLGSLLLLIYKLGPDFWIWFWLVISVFLILVNMFYTSLIVPIFNKLTPLEDGELRTAIQEYSTKAGFPLDNIFVIDGSKRSSKANAYFSGLGGKKKIVLYDTLIQNHSKEELVAVLAHEVGHFKKKHIIMGLVLSVLQIGLILFILSKFVFNQELSQALGATNVAIHLNLLAFGILFTPISHVIGIFMNLISRRNEFEADRFAASTYNGIALQEALKKLSVNNLSNLNPHPAYVFLHYSHPPLLQRLRELRKAS